MTIAHDEYEPDDGSGIIKAVGYCLLADAVLFGIWKLVVGVAG